MTKTSKAGRRWAMLGAATIGLLGPASAAQVDLLPDIIVRESDLYDHIITIEGGVKYLRLSNGTANIGLGKLYLYGVYPPNGDGTQTVRQRIYRDDGTYWDRDAGYFTHHDGHGHIHFDNWAAYRLREILVDDGVGDIVAEGEKTSFCILDLGIYDSSLPNFDPDGQFHSCSSSVQGLSVGWIDIYSKGLEGQVIPIDGVPDGEYWLESEVDPLDAVLESDETDNITRIKVTISDGSVGDPDRFEPNDSRSETSGRIEGAVNSPNLGPCNPVRIEDQLSIHISGEEDWFRFYIPATGTSQDFARIDFQHSQGDLDFELYNDAGTRLGVSNGTSNSETITLNGRGEGHYLVRVYGWSGATSPNYTLTINPPANQPPQIEVLTPPPGDIEVHQGEETYRVAWDIADPENNSTWVTIFANTSPVFDGNEILMPTSINTPGDQGFYIINTAYLDLGTYWVLAEATDGGTSVGAVSPGTISIVEFCEADFNRDGEADTLDVLAFLNAWTAGDSSADMNDDGEVNTLDVLVFLNLWNVGC